MGTNMQKNSERINALEDLGLDYIIRRHPRDNGYYGDKALSKEVTREISDDDLLASFDYAILGASGMVNSLIGTQKPFYLLPGDFDIPMTEYVFFDETFIGNISEISDVPDINERELKESFANSYGIHSSLSAKEFYMKLLRLHN